MPKKKEEEVEEEEKKELPLTLKNSEFRTGPTKIRSINDDTLIKLDTVGCHTIEALSVLTVDEAVKEAEITEDRYYKIHDEARRIVGRVIEFAPLDPNKKAEYIPTGSKAVDELLDGGYQIGEITELCAQYAIGKTNSSMTASVMCWATFKAPTMYLHTELQQSFSHDRLIQIAKARKIDYPTTTDKEGKVWPGPQFTYCPVMTTDDQDWAVRNSDTFMKQTKCKLFVIDSMMSLYRREFQGRETLPIRQGHINRLLNRLTKISNIFGAAVLVTNQMVADPGVGANVFKPAGGPIMQYGVGKILMVKATGYSDKSINDKGEREIIITKSPNHPVESRSCMITERGLDDVPSK